MIYKCKNCGLEYDTPTDYCECGNNSFEIIGTEEENIPPATEDEYDEYGEIISESEKISPETNSDLDCLYNPKFKYTKKNNEKENTNKQKLLPILIFIISIIISIVLLAAALTMPASDKKKDKPEENQDKKIEKTIPKEAADINDFWDDTPAVKEQIKEVPPQKSEQKPKPAEQPKQPQTQQPKQNSKAQNQTSKTKTTASKTNENKTVNSVKEQPKPQPKTESKNTSAEKSDQPKENKTDTSEEDKAKLNTYKANLRKHLFSAFPVLTVQGSGTASVGFSISADGKLLNRRFVTQSDNKSLNDAMYHMLMKTPTYTAPPSAYKEEEIVLEMKFNNGKYSFTYLK